MKTLFCLTVVYCLSVPASADFLDEVRARYKQEAEQAQRESRWLDERNALYKYASLTPAERPRIQTRIDDLQERLRPEPFFPAPVIPVVVVEKPTPKKVAPTQKLSTAELIKKADLLRKNGQLDEALRFYKLAESTSPQANDIKEKIRAVEAEMN